MCELSRGSLAGIATLPQLLVQEIHQAFDVERLRQVGEDSFQARVLALRVRRVRGEYENRHVGGAWMGPKLGIDLESADVGQVEVEHDEIRRVLLGQLHTEPSLHRNDHRHLRTQLEHRAQQFYVRYVVFDHEDALRSVPRGALDPGQDTARGNRRARELGELQLKAEDASAWLVARIAELTPHRFHKSLGHRESESGSFHLRSFTPQPIKGGEKVGELGLVNSDSGVVDGNADPVAATGHAYRDGTLVDVVLDRVGKQIQADLEEAPIIGAHAKLVGGFRLKAYPDATAIGERLDDADRFANQGRDLDRLEGNREIAGFDSGQIENLVDKGKQMLPRPVDELRAF